MFGSTSQHESSSPSHGRHIVPDAKKPGTQIPATENDFQECDSDTPEKALERLYAGNRRFASGNSLAVRRDLDHVKAVANRQTPFAAFLGCADSRVPIEIVFDQGFGDLFVTRIAGNIASNENIGSLEFGTQLLVQKSCTCSVTPTAEP